MAFLYKINGLINSRYSDAVVVVDACIEESNGDVAAKALGDIARAQGMTKVAKEAGMSRESLYKSLSGEREPDFATILKVTRALGLKLHTQVL